jgi:hypothetical protein
MAKIGNCAPEIGGFLITTFIAFLLIILYLYRKLEDCNDSNYVRKNVNTYFYCKPNDSFIFNTNDSMSDFLNVNYI